MPHHIHILKPHRVQGRSASSLRHHVEMAQAPASTQDSCVVPLGGYHRGCLPFPPAFLPVPFSLLWELPLSASLRTINPKGKMKCDPAFPGFDCTTEHQHAM